MRLLRTGTYVPGTEEIELIQRWGSKIPQYAILSHTWSENAEDEVLLADVQNGTLHQKPACEKLLMVLKMARSDGYDWLWCDTCCIDKSSSVELSEDINSMYRYYENATKCYVYLAGGSAEDPWDNSDERSWWRRGWTLQELLAPTYVAFYSGNWEFLGTRDCLRDEICQASGIDEEYLVDPPVSVHEASIAKRMSWAAKRVTGREEDIAYSLLGLFDVNLSLLYGEGEKKAFLRLQEEVMRHNEDQSIFAWRDRSSDPIWGPDYHGLLAGSPENFENSGHIRPYSASTENNPSTMTARGLRISLPLTPSSAGGTIFVAALQCFPGQGLGRWFAVYLRRLPIGINEFARVMCGELILVSELGEYQETYIRQKIPSLKMQAVYPYHFFQIQSLISPDKGYRILDAVYPLDPNRDKGQYPSASSKYWTDVPLVYKISRTAGALSSALRIQRFSGRSNQFVLLMGTTTRLDIGFEIRYSKLETLRKMQESFSPQPAGTLMELEYHNVTVDVAEQVEAHQKLYLINIHIDIPSHASTVPEPSQVASSPRRLPISSLEEDDAEEVSGDVEVGSGSAEEGSGKPTRLGILQRLRGLSESERDISSYFVPAGY